MTNPMNPFREGEFDDWGRHSCARYEKNVTPVLPFGDGPFVLCVGLPHRVKVFRVDASEGTEPF